ncbi:MAG: hypothetical protein KGO81_09195 [Bacteroidota bacterium]|nr:hypothetical protein [Bacteroidota bacterium]
MGISSANYLPKEIKESQVAEFLKLLGYKRVTKSHFYFYDDNNLEQVTPIVADIVRNKDKELKVEITTTIWRSIFDHNVHNSTIKQLRLRFGGHFVSAHGLNRYIVFEDIIRYKSEAACYLAYFHFKNNLTTISFYLDNQKEALSKYKPLPRGSSSPFSTSVTIGLPFLVSILEEYLRSTYIGLLTYSDKKKEIFKSSRISNELLYDVTLKQSTMEKVIAQSKSFQNIVQLNSNFKEIDSNINFIDLLKRTQPRRKLLEKLSNLIENRHIIIHQAKTIEGYTVDHFKKDINLIETVVSTFYTRIRTIYKWQKPYL